MASLLSLVPITPILRLYIYIYTKDQDGTMRKTVSYMVQRKGLLIHDVMQTWGLSNLYIYIYILRSYDKNLL